MNNNRLDVYARDLHSVLLNKIRENSTSEALNVSRELIQKIAVELNISYLDCAAALALAQTQLATTSSSDANQNKPESGSFKKTHTAGIRLIRYRLDIGRNHKVNMEVLKKVLVEESGVDVNNIVNLRIEDNFSLVDLPDEMPQEIFHHLKNFEINSQKLAIKRLKFRNKRRGQQRFKRVNPHKTSTTQATHEIENR